MNALHSSLSIETNAQHLSGAAVLLFSPGRMQLRLVRLISARRRPGSQDAANGQQHRSSNQQMQEEEKGGEEKRWVQGEKRELHEDHDRKDERQKTGIMRGGLAGGAPKK